MADVEGYGLVILNDFGLIRIDSPIFRPEENRWQTEIAGEYFSMPDGIIGMALTPKINPKDSRYLLYRPYASHSLYATKTSELATSREGMLKIPFKFAKDVFPSQVSVFTSSEKGVVFFGVTREIAIACWNIRNKMSKEYFVSKIK